MFDDDASELFLRFAVPEKDVIGIDKASGEASPIEFRTYFDIHRGHADATVEVSDYQAEMPAVLRGDFLGDNPLEAGGVLITVADENVTTAYLGMPAPSYRSV